MRKFVVPVLAILCAAVSSVHVVEAAATPYPDRPITLVVPYSPGGAADLSARSLAAVAQKYLRQQIIVVNRVGANGVIGSEAVLNAPKDGYTLLMARVGSQVVGPALESNIPYNWNSFSILAMLEIDPYVCVVNKQSPFKSLNGLVDAARERPGKLNYATSGSMDTSVVFPVRIFLIKGLSVDAATPVPYKGGGETLNAVLAGHVDFACSPLAPYAGSIRSGDLRALVVSTPQRVNAAPDAPSSTEVDMPELQSMSGWTALYGPPGLPDAIVQKWTSVLNEVKADPDWIAQVQSRGSLPSIMSPLETTRFVKKQFDAYHGLAPHLAKRK